VRSALLIIAGMSMLLLGRLFDPISPEERARLVESVARSDWARALAARMATTPEAQERVARYLAESLVGRLE